MNSPIYICRNGKQFGPFSLTDTNKHLTSGTIQPTDLAWYDGAHDWMPIGKIPGVVITDNTTTSFPNEPSENMLCPNCHAETEPGQVICIGCGTNLKSGGKLEIKKANRKILTVRRKKVLLKAVILTALALAVYLGINHFLLNKNTRSLLTQLEVKTLETEANELAIKANEWPLEPQKQAEKLAPKPGELIWESTAPGKKLISSSAERLLASPSIGLDSNIYVAMPRGLIAVDKKTGEHLWTIDTNSKLTGWPNKVGYFLDGQQKQCLQYASLTPSISTNGTIYFGSEKLYAIKPGGKASIEWSTQANGGIVTAPLSIGTNGMLFAASKNKLLALNSSTGNKIWSKIDANTVSLLKGYGSALYSTHNSDIGGLNANTGQYFNWPMKQAIGPPAYIKNLGELGPPALCCTGVIYVVGSHMKPRGKEQSKVYALSETTCSIIWETPVEGSVVSSPSIGRDLTIYVGTSAGKVYAIDNLSGKHKWVYETGGPVLTTPAIGNNDTIYIGANDGKLYALLKNGELKWIWKRDEIQLVEGEKAAYERLRKSAYRARQGTRNYSRHNTLSEQDEEIINAFKHIGITRYSDALRFTGITKSQKGIGYQLEPNNRSLFITIADKVKKHPQNDKKLHNSLNIIFGDPTINPMRGSQLLFKTFNSDYDKIIEIVDLLDPSRKPFSLSRGHSDESIVSSPTIGPDGIVYFLTNRGTLYGVKTEATGAANSPWPMFGQNAQHTFSPSFPHVGNSRPPGQRIPWTYNYNNQSIDRLFLGKPATTIMTTFGKPYYQGTHSYKLLYRYDGMDVAYINSNGKSMRAGRFVWFEFNSGIVEKVYVKNDSSLPSGIKRPGWSIGKRSGRINMIEHLWQKPPASVYAQLGEPFRKSGRFDSVGWMTYILPDIVDVNGNMVHGVRIEIRRGKVVSVKPHIQGRR